MTEDVKNKEGIIQPIKEAKVTFNNKNNYDIRITLVSK